MSFCICFVTHHITEYNMICKAAASVGSILMTTTLPAAKIGIKSPMLSVLLAFGHLANKQESTIDNIAGLVSTQNQNGISRAVKRLSSIVFH